MSKIESNISEQFNKYFSAYLNKDFKQDEKSAINAGLTPIYKRLKENIISSGIRNANELSIGATKYIKESPSGFIGKVHVLGSKGRIGGFLRIFELGTYKKKYKNGGGLKPKHFLTNALSSTSNIEETVKNNLEVIIQKLNSGKYG